MKYKVHPIGKNKLSFLVSMEVAGHDVVIGKKENDGSVFPKFFKNLMEIERYFEQVEKGEEK